MAGSPRGRLLRTAGRALLVLVGLCVALAVINAFDEELSPEAAAYLAPEKTAVPDARNAYLALLGIDARPGTPPHQAGRKRLDAMAAAFAADPLVGDVPSLSGEKNPLAASGAYAGCKGTSSCLRDVAGDDGARAFVETNGLLLKRYRELLDYPEFSDAVPPSAFGTFPLYPPLLMQARQLFHADIARRVLQSAASAEKAFADLARQIEFDRRNLAAAGHSLSKLVFAAHLRDDYLLLSEALQAAPAEGANAARAVLRPVTEREKSLAKVLRSEGRQSAETLRRLRQAMLRFRNPYADIAAENPQMEVRSPFPSHSKAANFLLAWLYQPNAAINEWFRMHQAVVALAAEPVTGRMEAARGEDKWVRDFGKELSPNPFNLAGISAARKRVLPGHVLRYSFFLDDLDGLVRLVVLKSEILSRKLPPSRLGAYLETREDLRNTQTGAAMRHRVRQTESGATVVDLWFEPVNSSWSQRDFGLGAGKVAVTLALPAGSARRNVTR
jgi:hypothetical protein